ncbi:uncharacterized protein [Montipora foliosa]|uniref:uncharacterized protein n=1 Tax=Montipora foliosa TaxID=591990 RepID=UPI0035F1238D
MNSLPLTYEYNEVGAEMLTPSHLIYGRRLIGLPQETRDDEEENETGYLRRFRYLAKLRIHFWNRWRKEYLIDLRDHHRNKGESKPQDIEATLLTGKLSELNHNAMGYGTAINLAYTGVELFLRKGVPYLAKKPVEMSRDAASEAMRNLKL